MEKNKNVWPISRVVFVGVPWVLLYFYALVWSMLEFYSFVEGWIKNYPAENEDFYPPQDF